jgi:nucleoid-associated protein YgaU
VRTNLIRIAGLSLASAGTLATFLTVWSIAPQQEQHAAVPPAITVAKSTTGAPARAGTKKLVENPALSLPSVEELAATLQILRAPPSGRTGNVPTFDVARVNPTGDAVIAGRAAPGASVELLRAGKVHHTSVADHSGEFVMVPERLPPGEYELTLRATQSDGTASMSERAVAVAVANRDLNKAQGASASQVGEAAPPATFAAEPSIVQMRTLAVQSEGAGKLRISGRFEAGATVKLYLNEAYIASAAASEEGVAEFAIESGIAPGEYRVRVEQLNASTGKIDSRAEVTFSASTAASSHDALRTEPVPPGAFQSNAGVFAKEIAPVPTTGSLSSSRQGTVIHQATQATSASPATPSVGRNFVAAPVQPSGDHVVVVPKIDTALVIRGDNLWHISRSTYGRGVQFSTIYDANRDQIRDPKLIYPGQVFVLPRTSAGE